MSIANPHDPISAPAVECIPGASAAGAQTLPARPAFLPEAIPPGSDSLGIGLALLRGPARGLSWRRGWQGVAASLASKLVGAEVRRERQARRMRQAAMARRVGLGQGELSRREAGITEISIDEAVLIASVLGLRVSDLLAAPYAQWRDEDGR